MFDSSFCSSVCLRYHHTRVDFDIYTSKDGRQLYARFARFLAHLSHLLLAYTIHIHAVSRALLHHPHQRRVLSVRDKQLQRQIACLQIPKCHRRHDHPLPFLVAGSRGGERRDEGEEAPFPGVLEAETGGLFIF